MKRPRRSDFKVLDECWSCGGKGYTVDDGTDWSSDALMASGGYAWGAGVEEECNRCKGSGMAYRIEGGRYWRALYRWADPDGFRTFFVATWGAAALLLVWWLVRR